MQRMRPEASGGHPDARWQCSLPVLRDAPGAHLGLRPAAHRRRDRRRQAGLRPVLPGSAAAVRALRPDPEDRQAGNSNRADRNTARLALAAELPASALADLTGISISTAERWSQWAKRDWAAYVAERSASS